MMGDIYHPEQESLWLCFPPLRPYFFEAMVEPRKFKTLVACYKPLTRVQGDGIMASLPCPHWGQVWLPFCCCPSHNQVTTCLTDWTHQCAAQMGPAIINISLLVSSISSIAAQSGTFSSELGTEISKARPAILTWLIQIFINCWTEVFVVLNCLNKWALNNT